MKWVIVLLAIIGIVASSAALREHYNTGGSPCSINDKWDCGIVNHSPYAVLWGVPVAAIGIAGYIFLAALALAGARRTLLAASVAGLAFSLYLSRIEAYVLGVWCIYCVISLGTITVITLLGLVLVARKKLGIPPEEHASRRSGASEM